MQEEAVQELLGCEEEEMQEDLRLVQGAAAVGAAAVGAAAVGATAIGATAVAATAVAATAVAAADQPATVH